MSPIPLGILAGVASKPVVSGGTLFSDASYYYRRFTGSGTLAVAEAPLTSAEYIVVAGGGGSGGNTAENDKRGGAGGGGSVQFASAALPVGSYSALVGAGGPPGVSDGSFNPTFYTVGSNGGNTSFNGLTANGGGGGGAVGWYGTDDAIRPGRVGGNGGGGSVSGNQNSVTWPGGASNQGGFAGQRSIYNVTNQPVSGGGGGAGGEATSTAPFEGTTGNRTASIGGIGNGSYTAWATATSSGHMGRYAAGGCGYNGVQNAGGSEFNPRPAGGGGGITNQNDGQNGLDNTGGGASGSAGSTRLYTGGSGIVIVRYLKSLVD